MNTTVRSLCLALVLCSFAIAADEGPIKPLLDLAAPGAEKRLIPSAAQVTVARSADPAGLVVTIQPGKEGYPGISLKPEVGDAFDLAAFGHVEARIANLGAKPLNVSLRLDNPGDWKQEPWNAESTTIKPGATGTVSVIFGHSYGRKPAFPLNPAKVANVLLFATKSDAVQSFRIERIVAAGPAGEKPPVDPNSIRVAPNGGVILGQGAAPVDAAKQLSASGAGASATLVTQDGRQAIKFTIAGTGKGQPTVTLKPAVGRWDCREYLEVRAILRNAGPSPIGAKVRIESNGGPSEWVAIDTLAPGASKEVVVPFIVPTVWNGQKGTGNRVTNDAISAVVVQATPSGTGEQALVIESVKATMPPATPLPDWLGKRPPVDGEWTQTFNDDFDGSAIDDAKWRIYGENYWDKASHFSKENTLIGDGVVRLRFSKKHGHQNDDPNHKRVTAYATGYLDTYGKWTQRYGYFEARMKLPRAPGLWPAFWMMPDRGAQAVGKEQWKRQSTGEGGMEFDIMEHLTRWGPTRYNVAMHWDGYGKDHKSTGTDKVYVQPDKDGFITSGLLWTPGSLVFYANGREVARWDNERVASVPALMMFTLPMGGWDNSPLDDARLPDDFIIDYVRAWQRKDLASPK